MLPSVFIQYLGQERYWRSSKSICSCANRDIFLFLASSACVGGQRLKPFTEFDVLSTFDGKTFGHFC